MDVVAVTDPPDLAPVIPGVSTSIPAGGAPSGRHRPAGLPGRTPDRNMPVPRASRCPTPGSSTSPWRPIRERGPRQWALVEQRECRLATPDARTSCRSRPWQPQHGRGVPPSPPREGTSAVRGALLAPRCRTSSSRDLPRRGNRRALDLQRTRTVRTPRPPAEVEHTKIRSIRCRGHHKRAPQASTDKHQADWDTLKAMTARHGDAIGVHAQSPLDVPLPSRWLHAETSGSRMAAAPAESVEIGEISEASSTPTRVTIPAFPEASVTEHGRWACLWWAGIGAAKFMSWAVGD